jgi:hypothetical protein
MKQWSEDRILFQPEEDSDSGNDKVLQKLLFVFKQKRLPKHGFKWRVQAKVRCNSQHYKRYIIY